MLGKRTQGVDWDGVIELIEKAADLKVYLDEIVGLADPMRKNGKGESWVLCTRSPSSFPKACVSLKSSQATASN